MLDGVGTARFLLLQARLALAEAHALVAAEAVDCELLPAAEAACLQAFKQIVALRGLADPDCLAIAAYVAEISTIRSDLNCAELWWRRIVALRAQVLLQQAKRCAVVARSALDWR